MNYNHQNVFAKILRGEITSQKIYEDEEVLAFNDISQASKIHVLVIPKGHYKNYLDFVSNASENEVANFFKKVLLIAKLLKLEENGFRLITNNGEDAHQTVEHFHVHLLGGQKLGPLLTSDNKLR